LPAPQIILGAHLDAYRESPGANDNATGVGALLELARYFKDRETVTGFGLSFIAFGAEELGVLGSRQYVAEHAEDLESLVLVLALDNLGGSGPAAVERNGGESVVPRQTRQDAIPGPYRGRAWEGLTFPWVLLPRSGVGLIEAVSTSYHPPWLVESIDAAANEMGTEVTFTGVQFSDQMSFGMAGIATSAVGAVNGVAHTGGDDVESVQWDNLESCAELAARIVLNVMDRSTRLREPSALSAGER
jgi:Zn-dependent M28 family amino/carboxypeptidase